MEKVLVVRGMPLTAATVQAWKDGGQSQDVATHFMRSGGLPERLADLADRYDAILNLGRLGLDDYTCGVPMFNITESISMLNSPVHVRRSPLAVMLPPKAVPVDGMFRNVWVKAKGFHDKGNIFRETISVGEVAMLGGDAVDVQQHVEGQEYRVVTVGDRIVQASTSEGRVYTWEGVKSLPRVLHLAAKYAAGLLPTDYTVVGWDFIVVDGGEVFLLEGNSSLGVNAATAGRVLSAMGRRLSDDSLRPRYMRASSIGSYSSTAVTQVVQDAALRGAMRVASEPVTIRFGNSTATVPTRERFPVYGRMPSLEDDLPTNAELSDEATYFDFNGEEG